MRIICNKSDYGLSANDGQWSTTRAVHGHLLVYIRASPASFVADSGHCMPLQLFQSHGMLFTLKFTLDHAMDFYAYLTCEQTEVPNVTTTLVL